jgi:hypothetical protein
MVVQCPSFVMVGACRWILRCFQCLELLFGLDRWLSYRIIRLMELRHVSELRKVMAFSGVVCYNLGSFQEP